MLCGDQKMNMVNFSNNMADGTTSIFCRAHCSTLVQCHKLYQLCPSEVTQQVHLELLGYIPNLYKAYSWTTGFAWTLHVVINIQDVLNNMDKDKYDAHFAFQQCLEYAGTTMQVNMPADVIQQVMVYGNKYGANICPQRQPD